MKINLNDVARFIITAEGLDVLRERDKALGLKPGHWASTWRHDRADNTCEAPLWDVMSAFGERIHMGMREQLIEGSALEVARS